MVISSVLAAVFSALVFVYAKSGRAMPELSKKNMKRLTVCLFASALVLRLVIAYLTKGFETDIALFKFWGESANNVGYANLYSKDIFLDYPPGYIYVLSLLDHIKNIFGLQNSSQMYTFIMKIPAILGDLACAGMLLYIIQKHVKNSAALVITAMFLFCPLVIINSSNWGQMDVFCLAIFLFSAILLYKEKYNFAGAIYGLSIITKPQMLTFVPFFLLFAIKKKSWKHLITAPLAAIGVIALVALPFTKGFDFRWLIEQYKDTMNGYQYYSVNAYNFWGLIGKNWHGLPFDKFTSMAASVTGPIIAVALCSFLVLKSKRNDVIFAAPIVLMSIAYMFTVKMHERYVFPIFIFILICFAFCKDRRLLYSFATASFAHYLNVKHVLYIHQVLLGDYDPRAMIVKVISFLQIAAYLYLLYVIYDIYIKGTIKVREGIGLKEEKQSRKDKKKLLKDKAPSYSIANSDNNKNSNKMSKMDWRIALIITVVYAFAAFANLGSMDMPMTAWTPRAGETVVIKTDNPADTIAFMPGLVPDDIHYRAKIGMNVKVEYSEDSHIWRDGGTFEETGVFAWRSKKIENIEKPVLYFRFTALDDSVVINEIALRNSENDSYYEVVNVLEGNANNLFDEQKIVPIYPTYMDSTYFDEIYHARTAYEHILELEPYENTHPPLGKFFIAIGINMFGMNPFGWRFAGALFGVLMLPLFYHLLKQIFRRSLWATVGTLLFALDFMHFTQTRIATIDTYAVFFIIAMYSAMLSFCQKDILEEKMSSLIIPLAISGVLMGIGIASKWTVAYGAAGLAVLLFAKLIFDYINLKQANKKRFRRRCIEICLWCVLLFIAVPFLLYFIAFLPMTTLKHQPSVFGTFINYQTGMFNYHSKLVAEHPFTSPWYQWPIMTKPMWFHVNYNLQSSEQISTIASFGNPAVWWVGIPAMIFMVIELFRKKSRVAFFTIIGFLSVYLPWVLVSRIAFIYHYFTAVPFVIIAIVFSLRFLLEQSQFAEKMNKTIKVLSFNFNSTSKANNNKKGKKKKSSKPPVTAVKVKGLVINGKYITLTAYILIAAVLFVVFFPVLSGVPANRDYINGLKWLKSWVF